MYSAEYIASFVKHYTNFPQNLNGLSVKYNELQCLLEGAFNPFTENLLRLIKFDGKNILYNDCAVDEIQNILEGKF